MDNSLKAKKRMRQARIGTGIGADIDIRTNDDERRSPSSIHSGPPVPSRSGTSYNTAGGDFTLSESLDELSSLCSTAGLAPASPERIELMDSDEIMGEQEVRRFVLALQESGEDYIPLQKLLFGPQTRNELSHLHHSLIEMVLAKMEDENILMYRNQVIEFI